MNIITAVHVALWLGELGRLGSEKNVAEIWGRHYSSLKQPLEAMHSPTGYIHKVGCVHDAMFYFVLKLYFKPSNIQVKQQHQRLE